jgi:hypothetical protein
MREPLPARGVAQKQPRPDPSVFQGMIIYGMYARDNQVKATLEKNIKE